MSKKEETKSLKVAVEQKSVGKFVSQTLEEVNRSADAISGLAIADDDDYESVCNLLFEVAEKKKEVAAEKDKVIAPAKSIIETVSGWFKPLERAIVAHEENLKNAVRNYNIKGEEQRAKLLKDAAKLQKLDPSKARELYAHAESALVPKVKGVSFVGKLKVEVTDESKLPEQFFKRVIDMEKLQAHVEAGEVIPGVLVIDNRTVRVTPSQRDE